MIVVFVSVDLFLFYVFGTHAEPRISSRCWATTAISRRQVHPLHDGGSSYADRDHLAGQYTTMCPT